jgi:hypothetical protein
LALGEVSLADPGTDSVGRDVKGRDRFEWLVLAALAALAFSVLAGLIVRTIVKGGVVTGGDGYLVVDPLQYLNWLRQSGSHFAAANLYDFAPRSYTFVHPGVLLAGLAHRLGLGLVASYALAKPFAVAALFFGFAGLVHRHLERTADRRLALVVGLFYCAPAAAIAGWTLEPWRPERFQLDFAGGETWTGSYLWGYVFTAIAVGLVPLGLLAWERGRSGSNVKATVIAATCALFAAWLQPWQGATLAGVVLVTEAVTFRAQERTARRAATQTLPIAVFAAVPLIYYWILSHTDPAWKLAGIANNLPRWPLWVLVVTIIPLALPAAFAFRRADFKQAGSASLRVWPLVAIAVYYAPLGTFPFHAVQGIQFPLAVLAVIAWRRHLAEAKLPALAAVALAAVLILPGTAYRVQQMRNAVNAGLQPFFLTDDEHDALRFIEQSKLPGGVMTENYLGTVIPAYTGRQTWLGAGSWSPNFESRRKSLDLLFSGRLSAKRAKQLVVRPGAGFVLDDCRSSGAFADSIAPFTTPVFSKGCVVVYRVNGAPALK